MVSNKCVNQPRGIPFAGFGGINEERLTREAGERGGGTYFTMKIS